MLVDVSLLIYRNELAGAAFRFGHSQINGLFSLRKDDGTSDFVNLRPMFFNSEVVYDDGRLYSTVVGIVKVY